MTVVVGLAGVLVPLLLRLNTIQRENSDAHKQIGENINKTRGELAADITAVDTRLSARIDAIDKRDVKRALAVLDTN